MEVSRTSVSAVKQACACDHQFRAAVAGGGHCRRCPFDSNLMLLPIADEMMQGVSCTEMIRCSID